MKEKGHRKDLARDPREHRKKLGKRKDMMGEIDKLHITIGASIRQAPAIKLGRGMSLRVRRIMIKPCALL